MDLAVCVVLPAGGNGERFGASKPKQYQSLLDRPLFLYTLEAFHRYPWIKKVVVTVATAHKEHVEGVIQTYGYNKVIVTEGSATRHRSICNGVKALESVCTGTDVVLIHDIVRVFVQEDILIDVAKSAKQYGAAGITRPLTSTVIARDADGFLAESLDRTKYLASEMPQGFLYQVIKGAYEKATEYDFDFGTECLHLAMKYMNSKVKLVDGPDSLWKVTYRKDIHAANGILKESLLTLFIGEDKAMKDAMVRKFGERNLQIDVCGASSRVASASSFVILHSSRLSDVVPRTEEVMNLHCDVSTSLTGMIDKVLVHIVTAEKTTTHADTTKVIQSCANSYHGNKILNFGIMCPPGCDFNIAAEMAATLIWSRAACLSGQVLVAPLIGKEKGDDRIVSPGGENCA